MTNCLTQTRFSIRGAKIRLVTASTDGYFALWDLTSTLEKFYDANYSPLKARSLFAGPDSSPEKITYENRYRIHSNSIKAMELVPITDDATCILAGGDDNSLSISLLKTTSSNTPSHVATISIPDAHAASLEAVEVLRKEKLPRRETIQVIVATAGNDHRLKIWSITVDPSQPDTQGINVEFLLDRYTSVADISSLGIIQDRDEHAENSIHMRKTAKVNFIICGVGMELLEVGLP